MKRKICGIEKKEWSMNGNSGVTTYLHVYDPDKRVICGISPESFKVKANKGIDVSQLKVNDTVELYFDNWRNLDTVIKVQ